MNGFVFSGEFWGEVSTNYVKIDALLWLLKRKPLRARNDVGKFGINFR